MENYAVTVVLSAAGVVLAWILRWLLSVSLYNTAVWLMQTAGECVNCEDEATLQYTNERDYFLFCETCAREKFDSKYEELRRTGFLKKWRKKST